MPGQRFDGPGLLARKRRQGELLRVGGLGSGGEMTLDVVSRAHVSLLLTTPQSSTDGPPGLQPGVLENPQRLHDHRAVAAVVGGAGAGVPGVEVATHHDNLVGEIRSLQVGDGVVSLPVLFEPAHRHVDLELGLDPLVEEPHQPIVMFGSHCQRGHSARPVTVLVGPFPCHQNQPVVPRAGFNCRQHAFLFEKGGQLLPEFEPLEHALTPLTAAVARDVILPELLEPLFVPALEEHGIHLLRLLSVVKKNDRTLKLAAPFLEIFFGFEIRMDDRPLNRAIGPGRPGFRQGFERLHVGAQHAHLCALHHPTATEFVVLEPGFETPFFEGCLCPLVGLQRLRRAGQPRPHGLGDVPRQIHDLRVMKSLVANAGDGVEVDRLLGNPGRCSENYGHEEERRLETTHEDPPFANRRSVAHRRGVGWWMPDAGCRMLDAGCWMLDAGCD